MLYQISFSITLADGLKALELAEFASDCLDGACPEGITPNISFNPAGTCTVTADLHLQSRESRDRLHAKVSELAETFAEREYGFLARHDCGHDLGLACGVSEMIEWGERDG